MQTFATQLSASAGFQAGRCGRATEGEATERRWQPSRGRRI